MGSPLVSWANNSIATETDPSSAEQAEFNELVEAGEPRTAKIRRLMEQMEQIWWRSGLVNPVQVN